MCDTTQPEIKTHLSECIYMIYFEDMQVIVHGGVHLAAQLKVDDHHECTITIHLQI